MDPALADLAEAGAKPVHLDRVTRVWLTGSRVSEATERDRLRLPRAASELLVEVESKLDGLARVVSEHPSDEGDGARLVVELRDGRQIESVLLPRDGVCISTQVGCAVGCSFCMTGTLGLERQLDTGEILAQVVLARRRQSVRRVVFMGMGEPSHNLPAVLEAVTVLTRQGNLRRKELVVLTVGDLRTFEAMAANPVRPALALSLHSLDRRLRESLLPRAPKLEPSELLEAALAYAELAGCPLQIQWTLLEGVNDGEQELARLIEGVRGRRAVVDYIPYNPVEAFEHRRTSRERTHQLTRALHAEGILAKRRNSAGQDIDGGCGQLRARTQTGTDVRR